jgi:hypothetical protein
MPFLSCGTLLDSAITSRADQMPFVRFFVGLPPAEFFRRAVARRATRVRHSFRRAFSASCRRASALHFTQLAEHLPTLYARSQQPARAFIGTK